VPAPTGVTWADRYRLGLGLIMIPLGIIILVRTLSAGIVTLPAIVMGGAFIAFGTYRLYVWIVRYRVYRNTKPEE
jgi:hypothetical protein